MAYRFALLFPGLEQEKPAYVNWLAASPVVAANQIKQQFPDVSIRYCGEVKR